MDAGAREVARPRAEVAFRQDRRCPVKSAQQRDELARRDDAVRLLKDPRRLSQSGSQSMRSAYAPGGARHPNIAATGVADPEGDKAFDGEDFGSFATVPVTVLPVKLRA